MSSTTSRPCRARLEQEAVERVHVVLSDVPVAGTCRSSRIERSSSAARERGVEHERGGVSGVEPRQEVARERGLARAHLARDQDEAAPLLAPELEVREGLGVLGREVEVLRVGGEVEGLLARIRSRRCTRYPKLSPERGGQVQVAHPAQVAVGVGLAVRGHEEPVVCLTGSAAWAEAGLPGRASSRSRCRRARCAAGVPS